jgi:hypothetical protein
MASQITVLQQEKASLIQKVEILLVQLSKLQTKLGESEENRINLESLLKLSGDSTSIQLQETLLKYRYKLEFLFYYFPQNQPFQF